MIAFALSTKRNTHKKTYIRHNDLGKVIICAGNDAEKENAPAVLLAVETSSAKKIERDKYDLWTGLRSIKPEMLDAADVQAAFDELEREKDADGKTKARGADICIAKYKNGEVLFVSGNSMSGLGNCHLFYKENSNLHHAQFFEDELYIKTLLGVRWIFELDDSRFPRYEHNIDVLPMDFMETADYYAVSAIDKIMEKGSKRLVSFAGVSHAILIELQPTHFRDATPSTMFTNGTSVNTAGFKEVPLTDRIWMLNDLSAEFNLTRIPNNELDLNAEDNVVRRAILMHQLNVARFNLTNSQCVYVSEKGQKWFQELSPADRKIVLDYAYDVNSVGREQAMDFMRAELRRTGELSNPRISRIRTFYSLYAATSK